MLYFGLIATALSGKLDGIVWAHNRGGPYARNLTVGTDPNTAEQQACRNAMATAKGLWDGMTQDQRAAWYAYSLTAPRRNRIGTLRPAGGWPEFSRANIPRGQANELLTAGLTMTTTPPSSASGTGETPVSAEIDNATAGEILFSWPDSEPWVAGTTESGLLIWLSDHQPQTINFFRTPFTLVSFANGQDYTTGRVATMRAGQFPIPSGRRIFWRVRSTYADGRLGAPQTGHLDS